MHLFYEFCDLQTFYFLQRKLRSFTKCTNHCDFSPFRFKIQKLTISAQFWQTCAWWYYGGKFCHIAACSTYFCSVALLEKEDDGSIWKTIRSTSGTGKQPPSKIRASFSAIQFHLMVVNNFWNNELPKWKAILSPTVEWNFKRLLVTFFNLLLR